MGQSINNLIKYALTLEPSSAFQKGLAFIRKQTVGYFVNLRMRTKESFCPITDYHHNEKFNRIVHNFDFSIVEKYSDSFKFSSKQILGHVCNLLGSGDQLVNYGTNCRGFLGFSYNQHHHIQNSSVLIKKLNKGNRSRALQIRRLISNQYKPIETKAKI